jgi:hypothetical protein
VPALLVAGLIATPGQVFAQQSSDDDRRGAVLEIGAAGEWVSRTEKPALAPASRSR